jgi:hypothetical protein
VAGCLQSSAIASGSVSREQVALLDQIRKLHGVGDVEHARALRALGLTAEDFAAFVRTGEENELRLKRVDKYLRQKLPETVVAAADERAKAEAKAGGKSEGKGGSGGAGAAGKAGGGSESEFSPLRFDPGRHGLRVTKDDLLGLAPNCVVRRGPWSFACAQTRSDFCVGDGCAGLFG